MRLFLSLSEEDMQKFDRACEKAGMKRSQYFKYLLRGVDTCIRKYRERPEGDCHERGIG